MFKKKILIILSFLQFAIISKFCACPPQIDPVKKTEIKGSEMPKLKSPEIPKIEIPKTPKAPVPKLPSVKPPSFFKDFLALIKTHSVKKPTKQNLNDSILTLNAYISILDSILRELTPLPPQKLIEFSLHAIEQSKYLSLYDSKNHYRSEAQWSDYFGGSSSNLFLPFLKRNWDNNKTLYGFHPFWMGQNYYNYNFEIYDRVAYYGYSVNPNSGRSATSFPAHSFATSQIVKKANERSGGKCKIDLCIESYGINNNSLLFSDNEWQGKSEKLIDEVVALIKNANAGGLCIDFQQVATSDSSKFIQLVSMFHSRLKDISPNTYQISIVLPSYSRYFPYTMSSKNIAQLSKYVDRFIVMGYSSYSGIYKPAKDTLSAPISHDILWNVLLVDDGINHYASLVKELNDSTLTSEKLISNKLILSLPANEIRVIKADSVQIVTYSDLKLLKLDSGFLKSFKEKLTYAKLKNLKGVALWSTGYDNNSGNQEIHSLLSEFVSKKIKQDEDLLKSMEKLISENKTLAFSLDEFFSIGDSSSEISTPLPEILMVDLPLSEEYNYKTFFDKEALIIHHIVVLCLIIFLFFASLGIIIGLFSEPIRELYLTRENIIFFVLFFILISISLLLKKLNVFSNTVFLFTIGIIFGSLIPYYIKKKKEKNRDENRP